MLIKLLRWIFLNWKKTLWGLAVVLSLIIFLLFTHGDRQTISALSSQLAAERWQTEEKPYAMASVFLPDTAAIPQTAVDEIRLNIEKAVTAAGLSTEEYPWLYAFSQTQKATLKSGLASTDVEMTMISGDYFTFHPLPIRTGWYFSESELMRDRIILDRQTAWDLFYSDNVVGQALEWDGQKYVVAAVVDTESSNFNDMAASATKRAWAFADSPAADETAGFTCVELVLPQPVDGFAVSTMQSVLEAYLPDDIAVTDNTERFSLLNRWNALRSLSTRWLSFQGIDYPYYENAAKLVENHLALRLIPEGLLILFVTFSVLTWLWMLNKKRTWGVYNIVCAVERAVERKRRKNYEAKLRGEAQSRRRRRKRSHARKKSNRMRHRSR